MRNQNSFRKYEQDTKQPYLPVKLLYFSFKFRLIQIIILKLTQYSELRPNYYGEL